ncbi:MAG: helix-turn-helix domain-containing protein [Planctomycetota bacterium]
MKDMENLGSLDRFSWLGEYTKILGSALGDLDRGRFLGDLVKVVLNASRANRLHAVLMEQDTVIAEGGADSSGMPYVADEESRKATARQALSLIRDREQNAALDGTYFLGREGGRIFVSIPLRERVAAGICLEGLSVEDNGLPLALSQLVAAVLLLTAGEAGADATMRAEKAEARLKELESAVGSGGVGAVSYLKPVAELERDAIELALRSTKWNKEEAARRLGISRASIYMKVKKFGLQKPI